MNTNTKLHAFACALACLVTALALPGCLRLPADPPATVSAVDLARYTGLWYEIASYPQFFNRGLAGVTAEYALLDDGRVSVFNRGLRGGLDGPETTIAGKARVVDPATNAKLAVRFDQFPTNLFEGQYWIVLLDPEYQYAAVSDPRRATLFILSRTPQLDPATYQDILAQLAANGFDLTLLRLTEQPAD